MDLGARYATTIAGKKTVFRANVDNAFDRETSTAYGYASAPRTVLLSACSCTSST